MNSNTNDKHSKAVVPLSLICGAIEEADNEWRQYLDIQNMEVVSLPEYPFGGEYEGADQELADLIEEEWNVRFFGLPTTYDVHEYSIMEEFIWELPEGRIQDSLEKAIRGKGAFRRFKDTVRRFDMEQQWYDFLESKYRDIAVEWCEDHGFEYSETPLTGQDTGKPERTKDAGHVPKSGMKENLAWKELSTEHIIQDEWIDFRRSVYEFPDGKVFEPFYTYSRKDYVVIVASDEEGKYLCVRQFRQGIREVTTEFPAGGIERADGKEYGAKRGPSIAEEALSAAKRELLEETGYESDEWSYLLTVPSNATMADNYAHIFMAGSCRRSGKQHLDETEFLNVKKYSAHEIEEMIEKGNFQQAVHIMAWLLSRRR
jgi:ADP-ribose pyrophosphatase